MTDIVTRLENLDREVRGAVGLPAASSARDLDEAITNATETTILLRQANAADSLVDPALLVEFMTAQVRARELRERRHREVLSGLSAGVRRMRKADTTMRLARAALAELCDTYLFDGAAVSRVESSGFTVISEPDPVVLASHDCPAERACVQTLRSVRAGDSGLPATQGYQTLLESSDYLVTPVISGSRVVALLHVTPSRPVDTFAATFALLYERLDNAQRVERQRTAITEAARRLSAQAARICEAAIGLDDEPVDATRCAAPPVPALVETLSERERQVFERLVMGASNAEIADELVITVETVKTHVKQILRKVGAVNRAEVIALYLDEFTRSGASAQRP